MLPAEPILRAAKRWIALLRTSNFTKASGLLRADPRFTDLTTTQYSVALEWLKNIGVVVPGAEGYTIVSSLLSTTNSHAAELMFQQSLEHLRPAWLRDADLLVGDEAALPSDASELANSLGITDSEAVICIRRIHGKLDLAERLRVGALGETGLVQLLEQHWPGSTIHVSADHDGWGYDVLFRLADHEWMLEVKSTTRRGRLVMHLTRHEYEIGQRTDNWVLIALGLDDAGALEAIATVQSAAILDRAPLDTHSSVRWDSAAFELSRGFLKGGLAFLPASPASETSEKRLLYSGSRTGDSAYLWMPASRPS